MSSSEARFVAAISSAGASGSGWKALDELADGLVGHRLFTVTLVDEAADVVRRAYSSHPAEYPTSGTKPLRGNAGEWFEMVFTQRRTFVANSNADISEIFPDHELIASLGCGSIINLPIVVSDELVAMINLLHAEEHFTPERVAIVETRLAIAARLCCVLARRSDAQAGAAA